MCPLRTLLSLVSMVRWSCLNHHSRCLLVSSSMQACPNQTCTSREVREPTAKGLRPWSSTKVEFRPPSSVLPVTWTRTNLSDCSPARLTTPHLVRAYQVLEMQLAGLLPADAAAECSKASEATETSFETWRSGHSKRVLWVTRTPGIDHLDRDDATKGFRSGYGQTSLTTSFHLQKRLVSDLKN
jgi:hypothetical protein